MRRAGFWVRLAAALIDSFCGGLPAPAAGLVVYVFFAQQRRDVLAQFLFDIVSTSFLLAYTSMEVWLARSPGKMLFGLVIARVDASRADRWTLFLRWSTKFSPYLIGLGATLVLRPSLLIGLSGLMNGIILTGCFQALDEDKRTWHDQWSRTAVFWKRTDSRAVGSAQHAGGRAPEPQPAGAEHGK